MNALLASLTAALLTLATVATADDEPAVLELFTSQGCSACPPADALLARLAKRDDVIALALHVGYWDYIGWKDGFAAPEFTERQKAYARRAGSRNVYTPQMVVSGRRHIVGFKPMEVADFIQEAQAATPPVALEVAREGEEIRIRAEARSPLSRACVVHLVRYDPFETVAIGKGENAGRVIDYANIVTEWREVARWDGAEPLDMKVAAPGEAPVVVIVQQEGPGEILSAARLR